MQSNQLAQTIRWVNGWKSINNGVTTGGLFWLGASRSISRVARALVYRAGPANPPVLQAKKNRAPGLHVAQGLDPPLLTSLS